MYRVLRSWLKGLSSEGERAALRALATELRISHYHRQGLRKIKGQHWSRPAKLHLGSGRVRKDGFLNVDLLPGGDLTLDLRRGLPFDTGCCDLIFSEHFFEHIDYPDTAFQLFAECLRVLKPGGVLRFSVPDAEWPLRAYAQGEQTDFARVCKEQPWGYPAYCTTFMEYFNHGVRQSGEHRFSYDEETARKALEAVGFAAISRVTFDPSQDATRREIGSLVMSARKPA